MTYRSVLICRNEGQNHDRTGFKKYVLTKDLACLFFFFPFLFLSPAASLKPMRDCVLFDSYSESLPGGQQTRDFSQTEVRRCKQGIYLAESQSNSPASQ